MKSTVHALVPQTEHDTAVRRMTGGEALAAALMRWGVTRLYGLPGVQLDRFFDALERTEGGIAVIHTRHEQGAAYMAFGDAASTGEVAVCAVVPGPGVLNAGAALATAYACNAPVLCITSTIPTAHFGRGNGALHEIVDQAGCLRGLTKWTGRASSAVEIPDVVDEAFRQMLTGRPRPVAIEVPPDVLSQTAMFMPRPRPTLPKPPPIDPVLISAATELLAAAKEPMILVGSGARRAGAEVARLAELLQAPVVSRTQGRGIVADGSPYAMPAALANQRWADVDVVLAIGTRLTQLREWGMDAALKVVHIDIDYAETVRIRPPAVGIVADAKLASTALADALEARPRTLPASRTAEFATAVATFNATVARTIQPQADYLSVIRQALPDDGVLVDEMTQVGFAARFAFPVRHPYGFVSSSYQGTLGFGFATALGAQAARPGRKVISVNGDGGFLYTMPELATAALHGINLIAIVFADGHFGNVRRIQQNSYGGRMIASQLKNPDFVALARSFGIKGLRANSPETLATALAEALAAEGMVLIEVAVTPDSMASPWSYVHGKLMRGSTA
jgi:acetolactate synthase-1/2/3 large subunit